MMEYLSAMLPLSICFQISFNGAICPETFIGDYSFQEPRKEQVTSSILEQRLFWIMKLFRMNRGGVLPETVIITRDGVSEGQFKMVTFIPIHFCYLVTSSYCSLVFGQCKIGKFC